MPPRQTDHLRRNRRLQSALEAKAAAMVLSELTRMWRIVYPRLRRMDAVRPHAPRRLEKRILTWGRLAKQYQVEATLWDLFRQRLQNRLLRALWDGTIALAALEADHLSAYFGEPVTLDPDAVAESFRHELGDMIRRVEENTKREVGRRVVQWYNAPGETLGDLVSDLVGMPGSPFGAVRAKNIAVTEVTRLNDRVQEHVAAVLGLQEWWWQTMRDQSVCVKPLVGPDGAKYKGCRDLHGRRFAVGLKGPPEGSHIGCRCTRVNILPPRVAR